MIKDEVTMEITIEEFKNLCELLCNYLVKEKGAEIDLNYDYYWSIRNIFNVSGPKPEITLGSIYEDFERLCKILDGKDYPNSLDLEKLGVLFISLGQLFEEKSKT